MLSPSGLGRLQIKLLLLVLVASLPAFFLLFWLLLQERASASQSAKVELANMAQFASLNRERHLEGAQQVLKVVSRTPQLQDGDPRRCTEYLRDLLGRTSLFFNYRVFDRDGKLRCDAMVDGPSATLPDGSYARRRDDLMVFSVSPYTVDRISGRKALQFSHPLIDHTEAAQPKGAIVASLDLPAHEQSLAGTIAESPARLVFTDQDGIILGNYPAAPEKIGWLFPDKHLLDRIRGAKATLVEDHPPDGPASLHAIDVVRVGNVIAMHTILTMPLDAVVAKINRKFYWLFIALVAALIAVMLIAWWLGHRWIVRRVSLISDAASRIGQGERGVRMRLKSRQDELDLAGHAFDRMAEALEHGDVDLRLTNALERRDADLRMTNRRLAEAQRIAKLGHWEFDIRSNRGWWSAETSELFSIKAADDSFDTFLDWVHADDRKRVAAAFACVGADTPIDIEYRTIGVDGRLRRIHAVGEGIADETGRVVKLAGVIQDISERKESESTLKLLETAVSRANDIVFITEAEPIDEPGPRIVFVNDAFETRTGYTRAEVLGKSPRFLQGPNTSREALARMSAAMTNWKPVREELINYTKEGTPFWLELDIAPIADDAGGFSHWVAIGRDVTERKNVVAALVESEERYRQLFRANPLPIAIYDMRLLYYTAANDAFCRQYGYTEEELKSLRAIDLVAPALRDVVMEQIRSLPMGITTTKGLLNIRKDGTVIDVQVTRIRTEIGGREMVITSPIDITDRIRADNALKASEERYRILFENNPLPLWVFDPVSLRFLDVNAVACERYGYSRAEFLAMTSRDIRPPEDVLLLEDYLRTETRAVSVSGPWRHLRKDGSLMLVEVTMHEATLNGQPARFVCPIDVTEKVFAQEEIRRMNLLLERKVELRTEELARSLALQQSLFDSVPQVVWLADLAGDVTFANRVWSEKIGTVANDWKGDGWSRALHPDDRERVTSAWREAAPLNEKFDIEYRFLHRDGGYHDYQVNARKVFDKAGAPICWVGICSDVTDIRRREDALRFANQELEAFSVSVSHDLRAPLRTIDGFGERLQIESAGRLDEQGRHYLERIRAGAANMNELIDDLLSLSHVARTDMEVERVDLSAMAQQVFEELRQHQPERPMEIVVQDNMTAIGDARLLRVVLINLIGNAIKFSAKREVSRIEIGEIALPGDTSTFFIRDNGAGFDPAYGAKMFGVFQRLHSVAEFPGTGIGLATVQRIIHRHGGHVSADGEVDKGAKISFTLRRE